MNRLISGIFERIGASATKDKTRSGSETQAPREMNQTPRIFEIQYSSQRSEGSTSRINRIAMVVTTDAATAIYLVKQKDPGAEIWQCLHRGTTGYVMIDPRIAPEPDQGRGS